MPGRYDSEWLLRQVTRELRRPASDALMTPEVVYEALSQAQEHWIGIISVHVPATNYGPPTQLTSSDGGYTYYFGLDDDGDPITPLGEVEIRAPGPKGRVLKPSVQWGSHPSFVIEGNGIRFTNGRAWNPTNGLWARFVTPPTSGIDADTEPVLQPKFARKLLVPRACHDLAATILRQDGAPFLEKEAQLWHGDPQLGTHGILAQLKQQFYGQGTESIEGGGKWYDAIDDGSGYTKSV